MSGEVGAQCKECLGGIQVAVDAVRDRDTRDDRPADDGTERPPQVEPIPTIPSLLTRLPFASLHPGAAPQAILETDPGIDAHRFKEHIMKTLEIRQTRERPVVHLVPSGTTGRMVLLACGVLASLFYAAMLVVVPMRWEGYSSASQTVSELSAIGAPTRSLWVALAVVYTLLLVAFGWRSATSCPHCLAARPTMSERLDRRCRGDLDSRARIDRGGGPGGAARSERRDRNDPALTDRGA
jgi:hypothetical protein